MISTKIGMEEKEDRSKFKSGKEYPYRNLIPQRSAQVLYNKWVQTWQCRTEQFKTDQHSLILELLVLKMKRIRIIHFGSMKRASI